MLDKKYFDDSENRCWELFQRFNDEKLHLSEVGRTEYCYDFDASGVTSLNEKVGIELKKRNLVLLSGDSSLSVSGESRNGTFRTDTIYLEEVKMAELAVAHWSQGFIPLYVNFLSNAVVVFNLLKMRHIGDERTKVHSHGYQSFEIAKRFTLPLSEAWIYNNDNIYTLIHKPQ
jgi:hypothetical protein